MASIRKEAAIAAPAAAAWAALRDVGALHTRLVAGFVTDCRLEGDTRVVTFANGMVARERIVTVDDAERRVVWSATGDRLAHHNASAQVFDEGDGHGVPRRLGLRPAARRDGVAGRGDDRGGLERDAAHPRRRRRQGLAGC